MALSQSTLATNLELAQLSETFLAAGQALSNAFGEYMKEGTSNSVPITGSAVDSTAVPAMVAVLAPGLGVSFSIADFSTLLTNSIVAFWAAMVATPAAFLSGATVITPPTYAALAATLAVTLADNLSSKASIEVAMSAIASDIDTATAGLGTATFPGPIVAPII